MSLGGVTYLTVRRLAQNRSSTVIKVMYAAIAAVLLAPVPALAGDLGPPGYYGDDAYYDDYGPTVVERPLLVERPIVVERPVVIEKRVVVVRPLIVHRRPVIVERPVRYGYWRPYGHRHYGRHFDDDHRGYAPY